MAVMAKALTCPHCGQPAYPAPSPNTGEFGEFLVVEENDVYDSNLEMYRCSSGDAQHTFYTGFPA